MVVFKNQNGTQQVKHQLLKICGRYDTRDKKMIAIIHNFSAEFPLDNQ